MGFATKDQAIEYCNHNAFVFDIIPEPVRKPEKKSYSDNFRYEGGPKKGKDVDWD